MSDVDTTPPEKDEINPAEEPISLREFLERTHPSVQKPVNGAWEIEASVGSRRRKLTYPEIRLHCRDCQGERTFRLANRNESWMWETQICNAHPIFRCGDCNLQSKQYALRVVFKGEGDASLYKYGEHPAFGIPVPNRVLRLVGNEDAALFLKGRQCENLGYGIAAFAYYRRVVENHKNELFEEIIKVCETLGTSGELIKELKAAQKEISFSKSMEKIKTALPHGLLIDGHNPLNALHGALSVGLHAESDENCLANAQAVRLVLSELVERIALLKQENKQLSAAVHRLLSKR
ncbi:hypothetical protein HT585_22230 [Ensifer sp. HO-A22]|uniref:Uncharacterized protein n=1 Tax=Ensifer oleiphilus TaxID=2742698 RepID=A0A7Y6QA41_9HYPH|nr:hypothetical protein [Ensifer oleiphilus]NVD41590.1 hypothetical protein [Ensifer oleiphilus]